jgi:hypothetical protein
MAPETAARDRGELSSEATWGMTGTAGSFPQLCCQLKLYPPAQVYFRRSLISIETTFTPPVRATSIFK